MFQENAAYVRTSLVAASAVFYDLGDRRKTEYLEKIIKDALARGLEMKNRVIEQINLAGIPINEEYIRNVVLFNRREHREHDSNEIKKL